MQPTLIALAAALFLILAPVVAAQDGAAEDGAAKAAAAPRTQLADYGPSSEHPFGRMNPEAPEELAQFAFMIGEFDRVDHLLQQDGTWEEHPGGEWNATYIMRGLAIQDQTWNPVRRMSTTNLRFYDPEKDLWVVHWMKLPGYSTVISEGKKEGEDFVIRSGDYPEGRYQEYRFYDIAPGGYKWRADQVLPDGQRITFWRIETTRRR